MVAIVALVALAGCGSSKPAYCKNRSNLESSIKGLNVSGGLSGLQSQVQTIKSDATSLVSSAKSDFPSETTALQTSVNQLESALKALPASPSASQIATVASSAASVASSITGFVDASKSKCS
jgi:hypothetical protein